ncbi:MAG: DUF4825 domain-containing protein [Bacilli bacterium]
MIYPLWLAIYMSPIVFITIPISLLLIFLILLIGFKIIKEKNIKEKLKKCYIKVWLVYIFTNILSSIILLSVYYFINHLINYPLNNLQLIILIVFINILAGLITYFINNIYIKNTFISLLIALLTLPYLLFWGFSANEKVLDDYHNTYIGDNTKVSQIINLLKIDKESISLKTTNEPYELTINLNKEIPSHIIYKKLEQDSSILFNLITNLSIINYNYKEKKFVFSFNQLNKIFSSNLRNISINDINNRYTNMSNKNIYLGHINEYDIFDESITCESKEEEIKEVNNRKYYITCSSLNSIYLYNQEKKYLLKDKINELSIESLLMTNLNIYTKSA